VDGVKIESDTQYTIYNIAKDYTIRVTFKVNPDDVRLLSKLSLEYSLEQKLPNPFNPITTIRLGIPQRTHVRINIYYILGQEVVTLLVEEKEIGFVEVSLNTTGMTSGAYFCQIYAISLSIHTKHFAGTRKMLLIK
jgi:hypothetical protein